MAERAGGTGADRDIDPDEWSDSADAGEWEETTVSVVVPYSPDHTPADIFEAAVETAEAQSVPTELVVVEDTEQRGPSWARNRGLERADERYVAFLDADDYWHEGKLARQLEAMAAKDAGVCVESTAVDESEFCRELYLGNIASITSSVMIDTERIDAMFEEKLERREDHLFVLEAIAQGEGCFLEDLFTVGGHDGSMSQSTPTLYRLRQDYHFSLYVRERVPAVRQTLRFYERPRCEKPHENTPGDLLRLIFLWPSLLAACGLSLSLLCQRL